MKKRKLGTSDLDVSEICLGSMTWGTQNSEAEAHQQIDFARDKGVNFIDTAEMYPTTPISAESQGRTEEQIGTWIAKSGQRDNVIIATKIAGEGVRWVRNGDEISPAGIKQAVEGSLKRLQTDYIDLYQLHWPNRGSYHFRNLWRYQPSKQNTEDTARHIPEVLTTLQELIKDGKIRHIGLSNESCWGTAKFLHVAEKENLPRVVSIQNEYSLMQRIYDTDLAELSHNENVGLLAYSPLAAGMLSGKYGSGDIPKGSRRSINETLHGRYTSDTETVVRKYQYVADKHGLDLTQMSLSFCLSQPFMGSVIIGATTLEQLETNIAATEVILSDAVLQDIQALHRQHPLPF